MPGGAIRTAAAVVSSPSSPCPISPSIPVLSVKYEGIRRTFQLGLCSFRCRRSSCRDRCLGHLGHPEQFVNSCSDRCCTRYGRQLQCNRRYRQVCEPYVSYRLGHLRLFDLSFSEGINFSSLNVSLDAMKYIKQLVQNSTVKATRRNTNPGNGIDVHCQSSFSRSASNPSNDHSSASCISMVPSISAYNGRRANAGLGYGQPLGFRGVRRSTQSPKLA